MLADGVVCEGLCRLSNEADNVTVAEVQFLLAHVEPTEVKQFQHQVVELSRIAPGHVYFGADGIRQVVLSDFLQGSHNECQRCLQVVTDVGEETYLVLFHFIFPQVDFHLLHGHLALLTTAEGTPGEPDSSG